MNNSQTDIPRVSKHKVWFGFTVQNLLNFVNISPRIKWVSDMYNSNDVAFHNHRQPGYYTVDFSMTTKPIAKHFVFYATVDNLLNRKYQAAGLYEQSGVYTATIHQNGLFFTAGLELLLGK